MAKPASIEEYFRGQAAATQPLLQQVDAIIRRSVPEAEAGISYAIAAYSLGGRPLLYLAGWKSYYSLYPVTDRLDAVLGTELAPYKAAKGTLRFSLSEPVPEGLIERIALVRAAEVLSAGA
jgi:uncharacterized protein YdhG (YjbR/CyaY superfamily)